MKDFREGLQVLKQKPHICKNFSLLSLYNWNEYAASTLALLQ